MGKVAKYLNQLIVGNVFDNPEILEAYSTDRSPLKIKPKFVAFPESTDDIRKLLKFFNQLATKEVKIAITPRGSGNDTGGAALSNGLIISTEKMNKLLEIDPRERLVHVQAGITLKELNTALSVSGLMVPISGHEDDTIGGLISNCPIDNYAGKYGGIRSFVERIEVVLANGDCLQTNRLKKYTLAKKAAEKTPEGAIYRKIAKVVHDKKELLREVEDNRHSLAGYPGIADVPRRETIDLAPLFFGAQGTLGIISEVIIKAIPIKKRPARAVATFKELGPALRYAKTIEALKPEELNLCDLKIIMEARESGKNLDGIIRRLDDGYVVFASFADRINSRMRKLTTLKDDFPRTTKFIFESVNNRSTLNEFENSLENYLSYVKNGERVPVLTDFYLPSANLENFLRDIEVLKKKLKLDLTIYGSYATSIYNLRPKFNLEDPDYNKKVTTFLRAGAFVISRQGGKLAGGMPEGRLKAVVTNEEMILQEKELYQEIKKIFDQNNVLNPDVKLGTSSKFTLTHFRSTNQPRIMI